MKRQGGAVVHWAEEAAGMDVLGVHREPTSAGGANGETRVAVVVGRGKKIGLQLLVVGDASGRG